MRRLIIAAALILLGCGSSSDSSREVSAGENIDAQIDPASEVLQNCIEAAGGREAIDNLQVIHTVDSLSMAGLSGTTESWWVKEPFMGFSITELGPVQQEILILGDSIWTIDRNGHLSSGGVEAHDEMALSKRTIFYDYLIDTSMVIIAEDTLIDSIMTVPLHLEFQQEIVFYVSKETWLPVLMTAEVMGLEVRSYPDNYESVQGIVSPMSSRSVIPAFGQQIVTENILTEYNIPVPESLFTLTSRSGDWELEDPGTPMTFYLRGEHIYLEGEVNGTSVNILLDSGAGATVLDSTLASDLELAGSGRLPVMGIGGTREFSFVKVPSYSVAGALLSDQYLAVIPLAEEFYSSTGERIDLILGYDFLSRFVTRIDYGLETITLFDPDSFLIPPDITVLPAVRTMSLLSVEAVLEDSIPIKLLLDTGAGGCIHLTPGFFEKHPDFLQNRPSFETEVRGIGGEESILGFRVSSVTLGDFTVPGGICSSFDGGDIFNQFDGILGAGILSRFVVYLNYNSSSVLLEPSALFHEGLPETLTGMGLEIAGNELVISGVIGGSPADDAGIIKGDILLEVDGHQVSSEQLNEIHDLLPDTTDIPVILKVLREDCEIELELITGRLIP
ncbi:MAG: aspartyl protease family protein [Candidatus Aegiribacteria sp.]|nr:aspartyl protease family protein [Candidatus Aegiribacteria sp.]